MKRGLNQHLQTGIGCLVRKPHCRSWNRLKMFPSLLKNKVKKKMDWNMADLSYFPKRSFALLLILSNLSPFVEPQLVCEEGKPQDDGPVRISTVLTNSFSADIFSVAVNTGETFRVREHYSKTTDRSAVVYTSDGDITQQKFHIFNRNTNTGYSNFAGGKCEMNPLPPDFGLMSLKLTKSVDATYVGQRNVSNEPLHLWRACSHNDDFNYKEELYTTGISSDWESALLGDFVPVKMVVLKEDKSTHEITQTNHYILQYETQDDSDASFMTNLEFPIGIWCDTTVKDTLPQLPVSIMYSTESTAEPQSTTFYIVDSEKKLVVTEIRTYDADEAILQIDNYELGVMFELLSSSDTHCKVSTYAVMGEEGKLERSFEKHTSTKVKAFDSVQYFIGASPGFTFNGQHMVRGILCDVYTKFYDDYKVFGKSTVILYFSAAEGISATNSERFLVRKEVWQRGLPVYKDNIYDSNVFDYSRLVFDPLDITGCRKEMGGKDFGLVFETQSNASEIKNLKSTVRSALAGAAGVDFMRLQLSGVSFKSNKVMVRGILLGAMPEGAFIARIPNTITYPVPSSVDVAYEIHSGFEIFEDCEKFAFQQNDKQMFTYCFPSKTCIVFDLSPSSGYVSNDDCKSALLGRNRNKTLDLDEAWANLVKAVELGQLHVQDYTATKVSEMRDGSDQNITIPSISKYKKISGRRIFVQIAVKTSIVLSRCADDCTNSVNGECEAFTYCRTTQICYINPNPERNTSVIPIAESEHCDLYIRRYVTEFTAIEATSAVISTDEVYQWIQTPNECARICLLNRDFRCESFDFCTLVGGAGSVICSLGKQHFFDLENSTKKVNLRETTCTHYSRDYYGDYDRIDGITTLPVSTTMKKSSRESCARSCSKEDSSGEGICTMFQFCNIGSKCQFIDESNITSEAMRRKPDMNKALGCSTHILKKEVSQNRRRSAAIRKRALTALYADDTGYGPGVMAGVAIAMLFLGFGLVLLGIFIRIRYQKTGRLFFTWRGNDQKDLSVKFSKSLNDD